MSYLGDFDPVTHKLVTIFFTTHAASGASIAPLSAYEVGDIQLYKGNSATQRSSTTGWTITSPFDSITGLHCLQIDLSDNTDAGFYAAGNDFFAVLAADTETVDGLTVVRVIAEFSILNRTPLSAATQGRTVVVDAAGLIDANTVKVGPSAGGTAQTAGDIPARLPAALTANGNMKSSMVEILTTALTETAGLLAGGFKKFFNVAAPTGTLLSIPDAVPDAAGGLPVTGTRLTSIPWNAAWDAEVESEATDALNAYDAPTHAELTAELATADDATLAAIAALNNLSQANIRTAVGLASANLDTQLSTIDDFLDTEVAAIKAKTDNLPSDPADESVLEGLIATVQADTDDIQSRLPAALVGGRIDASVGAMAADVMTAAAAAADFGTEVGVAVWASVSRTLTGIASGVIASGELNNIADALLRRDWTAVAAPAARSALNALRVLRNKVSIAAGTMTVTEEDDATAAFTAAVSTTAGDPISSIDPT